MSRCYVAVVNSNKYSEHGRSHYAWDGLVSGRELCSTYLAAVLRSQYLGRDLEDSCCDEWLLIDGSGERDEYVCTLFALRSKQPHDLFGGERSQEHVAQGSHYDCVCERELSISPGMTGCSTRVAPYTFTTTCRH